MRLLHKLRDPNSAFSIALKMRSKRFEFFLGLIADMPKPISILDVGGRQEFWESMGFLDPAVASITILNLKAPESCHPNVITVDGDACAMVEFAENQFDLAFSNSVIEHVGDLASQTAMANEVQRVGRRYFVQTPNRYFPIEPHFMFPFFQFLPERTQAWLLMNLNLAWSGKIDDLDQARGMARSVALVSKSQFSSMFDAPRIHRERFFGLTKSFIAYGGW